MSTQFSRKMILLSFIISLVALASLLMVNLALAQPSSRPQPPRPNLATSTPISTTGYAVYLPFISRFGLGKLAANCSGDLSTFTFGEQFAQYTIERLITQTVTSSIAWSSDEQFLAYVSNQTGNNDIYLLRMADRITQQLTSQASNESHPTWSPDGRQIAFVSDRDGNSEIYLKNLDTLDETRLTNNPAEDLSPDWSPLGGELAFSSNRDGQAEIYKLKLNATLPFTEEIRLTTEASEDGDPAWSPDGRYIAYTAFPQGIAIIQADGMWARWGRLDENILNFRTVSRDPTWSPNGRYLAYYHTLKVYNYPMIIDLSTGVRDAIVEWGCYSPDWAN